MSDKTGFLGELTGEIGKTAGSLIGGVVSLPGEMIVDAAKQFKIPVREEYQAAQKAVQPRINYLSEQLRSIPRQEQQAQAVQEQKASLESPGRKPKNNFLNMIRRADKKDQKGMAA